MKPTRIATLLFLTLFADAQQPRSTPAPEDVPTPVAGIVSLAGAKCPDITRYLNVRASSDPSLSPDGKRLAYHSSVTGQPQLWVVDVAGPSAPRQLTFCDNVTFSAWSPTGDWLIYGTDHEGNEREGYFLVSPDGTRERELLPSSDVFRSWGGFSRDGKFAAFSATAKGKEIYDIYVLNIATGNVRPVVEGRGSLYVVAWRPDGKQLLLSQARGEDAFDIYSVDLETGRFQAVFKPDEPAYYGSFNWLPDGSGFYLVTNEGKDFQALGFFDFKTQKLRYVESPNRDVESVSMSHDGRYLLISENDNGFSRVHVRDLKTGANKILRTPNGVLINHSWATSASKLSLYFSAFDVPGDIWVYDAFTDSLSRVTDSSLAGLEPATFVAPTGVGFPSFDGEKIFGQLYLPAGASMAKKAPALLSVHGGPTSQARPKFNPVHQYFLARGYAVLDLNFRGSTGYGKRFTRLDNLRLRPNAVRDMQAAADWLQSTQPVNGARIAVTGISYGGYMTFAALTQLPDRFKAGVGFVGVSNWITALKGASPQLKASDRLEYGNIEDPDDQEFFRKLSPLTHVSNVKAPLLVLHGANDPRDPVTEADQFVQAIRERNGIVEYLRFPDEGHFIHKLSNKVISYRRMAAFLERYIGKGVVNCGQ